MSRDHALQCFATFFICSRYYECFFWNEKQENFLIFLELGVIKLSDTKNKKNESHSENIFKRTFL